MADRQAVRVPARSPGTDGTRAVRSSQVAAWHRLRHAALMLLAYVGLAVFAVFFLMPFLWMVSGSLKSMEETFSVPPHLLPKVWHLSNYPRAMTYVPFLLYLRNSLIICISVAVGTLLSCTLVAYSLSRVRWFGRGPLFVIVLASMMLPGQVTMIPLFITFRKLGWVGTYAPLIVPSFLR